ncbi:MAG TPA: TonB-dependent receptor [Bryobacteraceae bacterium]|nr:TonB-dependent receptor [Bryobacteraceae bacterium]
MAGTVVNGNGLPVSGVTVRLTGHPTTFRAQVSTNARGEFQFVLPYGDYEISAESVPTVPLHVYALRVTYLSLVIGSVSTGSAATNYRSSEALHAFESWRVTSSSADIYPNSYSLAGLLLSREPAAVTQPLDFTGLNNMRLALEAPRAFTWTGTLYQLQGMNATDPYQPGRSLLLQDLCSIDEIAVDNGVAAGTSAAFGSTVNIFSAQAGASWHGSLFTADTGSAFASDNLPSSATRNDLQQTQRFLWFTRDNLQVGGPIGKRADIYASGTGQWSSQTIPVARPGQDQMSRLLFGNVRGRIQATPKDHIDFQFTGLRINLSDWGEPTGIEALLARRAAPSFDTSFGFSGLGETNHLDFLQTGWTRQTGDTSRSGAIQVRYQFSTAHFDTRLGSMSGAQSSTDLLGGAVTGPAPLNNLAVRTRQAIEALFDPGAVQLDRSIHRFSFGGGWTYSKVQNRLGAPSDLNLITSAGAPAYVLELNTPLDSHQQIRNGTFFAQDEVKLTSWLAVNAGLLADFSRGSLPNQSSPLGSFVPARTFISRGDLISWNSAAPSAGVALAVPRFRRIVLRAGYRRSYQPLAGRYLDYGNPNSLGGLEYQWKDLNADGRFEPGEQGTLLSRFGGPYSSISPSLHRPYADEFDVGATASLPLQSFASLQLYRRDDKARIALINTGVPPSSFTPVSILDPGPDGIPGTADDQHLTVYQQNSTTLGQDIFLLTNPRDLRMQYQGFTAQVATQHRFIYFHASFTAEKSFGPTNPGDGVLENDPGVIGALYQDPNTSINAAGRDFFDRAYLGKVETISHLPAWLGSFDVADTVDYLDGLVFARRLLVTGLSQGPFLVDTTVRGSPEGGNRAEFVLNWNLRLARRFHLPFGQLITGFDLLNVTNVANRIQESYVSSKAFNERLPLAVQTPRILRISLQYQF